MNVTVVHKTTSASVSQKVPVYLYTSYTFALQGCGCNTLLQNGNAGCVKSVLTCCTLHHLLFTDQLYYSLVPSPFIFASAGKAWVRGYSCTCPGQVDSTSSISLFTNSRPLSLWQAWSRSKNGRFVAPTNHPNLEDHCEQQ